MSDKKYSQKNNDRPVTLAELQSFAKGILIDMPSFVTGEYIKVKVRRIDMSKDFLKRTEITNFLANPVIEKYMQENNLAAKNKQQIQSDLKEKFEDTVLNQQNLKQIQELIPLLDEVAKQILIEPSYEDFEKNCPLTQDQKEFLFDWAMGETRDLESFRNGGKTI